MGRVCGKDKRRDGGTEEDKQEERMKIERRKYKSRKREGEEENI